MNWLKKSKLIIINVKIQLIISCIFCTFFHGKLIELFTTFTLYMSERKWSIVVESIVALLLSNIIIFFFSIRWAVPPQRLSTASIHDNKKIKKRWQTSMWFMVLFFMQKNIFKWIQMTFSVMKNNFFQQHLSIYVN